MANFIMNDYLASRAWGSKEPRNYGVGIFMAQWQAGSNENNAVGFFKPRLKVGVIISHAGWGLLQPRLLHRGKHLRLQCYLRCIVYKGRGVEVCLYLSGYDYMERGYGWGFITTLGRGPTSYWVKMRFVITSVFENYYDKKYVWGFTVTSEYGFIILV